MPRHRDLMATLPALAADAVCTSAGRDKAAVATGNNQATAYKLKAAMNVFTTVANGTGAILDGTSDVCDEQEVFNGGANTLAVYPPVGQTINALAANTAFNVVAGAWVKFKRMSLTQWATN